MPRAYRSLTRQTLHYLIRPHSGLPLAPVGGPAAWRGDGLRADAWRVTLDAVQIAELERAIAHARGTRKPMGALTRHDFPLPTLRASVAEWRRTLGEGLGLQVIRGVPVDRWPTSDVELFFWCLGQHLGVPGAQNPQGDLLGHVRDEGHSYDSADVRGYRTADALSYHCDAADVVGLLCLQPAKTGGTSRVVSSVTVFDTLLIERPDLAARLFEPLRLDTRGDGGLNFFPVPPCRFHGGRLSTFYHSDYYRTSAQHPGAPGLSDVERELLDTYDAIASRPGVYLDMELADGDVQLLSNHTVLHARTGYVDFDEPSRKRHLLRLWLSLEDRRGVGGAWSSTREAARLLAALARGRLRDR